MKKRTDRKRKGDKMRVIFIKCAYLCGALYLIVVYFQSILQITRSPFRSAMPHSGAFNDAEHTDESIIARILHPQSNQQHTTQQLQKP